MEGTVAGVSLATMGIKLQPSNAAADQGSHAGEESGSLSRSRLHGFEQCGVCRDRE